MRLIDADELKTAFPCGEYVRTECVRATIDHYATVEPERKDNKMVVITSMESLPDHCYECPCHDGEHGYCNADKEERYCSEYRPYWCPLKEVYGKEDEQDG